VDKRGNINFESNFTTEVTEGHRGKKQTRRWGERETRGNYEINVKSNFTTEVTEVHGGNSKPPG